MSSTPAPTAGVRRVASPRGDLHVVNYLGQEPAIVAMHGFPDDSRIYDHLIEYLEPRQVVVFDWLGYGRSDRRQKSAFDPADRQRELLSVLDDLGIESAVLVGHDASGPEVVDFATNHPERAAGIVLLNTYYGRHETLRFPEMIGLMGDPLYKDLVDAMTGDETQRLWILAYTAERFGGDPGDPTGVGAISSLPQFFGAPDNPIALEEIRAWTADLPRALDAQDDAIASGKLETLDVPVTVAFGAEDPYLNPRLAQHLGELFRRCAVKLLADASHWPQWNKPEEVAEIIRISPTR